MSPKAFDDCQKSGGKIRTVSGPNKMMGLESGEYKRICILNNKVHPGYVKKKGQKGE